MQPTYRLYKYRSISGSSRERTARIITNNKIFYSSPEQLNDPYDCRFSISTDGFQVTGGREGLDKLREYAEEYLWKDTNKDISILCLSARNDIDLMWSHYADSHAGICLELTLPSEVSPYKVKYSNARPILHLAETDDLRAPRPFKAVIDTLTTKAPSWSYEEEWRCIDTSPKGERDLPPGALTGIIFGSRTPESDKVAVRDWVKTSGQNVTFYEASLAVGAYALDIKKVN